MCLILQVAQCFLDLRNLPNKMTEKAFPVPSSCSHLMFLLLLFFFCSACASCLARCESIISSPKTNTKIVSIQRPVEELRRVALNLLMDFCIPFSFCATSHFKIIQRATELRWKFNKLWLQHVKKSFGDQSQAKVPCPSNLRHMFKNNSLHFK